MSEESKTGASTGLPVYSYSTCYDYLYSYVCCTSLYLYLYVVRCTYGRCSTEYVLVYVYCTV